MPAKTPPVSPPSPFLLKWFRRYVRRFLRKNFHRVLLLGEPPAAPDGSPLIVYMNHPSWWDPMLGLFLAERYFDSRDHYAPIDHKALQRYGILKKLGFFGIETDRPRGAKQFLDAAACALDGGQSALWLTPQGEFSDIRVRPVTFKPGLAHLASRLDEGTALPLAVEYTFWEERTPQALMTFGPPIDLSQDGDPADWSKRLEGSLTDAQDRLSQASMARDPEDFTELLGGRSGIGGIYDLWRRTRAKAAGDKFEADHGSISSRRST